MTILMSVTIICLSIQKFPSLKINVKVKNNYNKSNIFFSNIKANSNGVGDDW